MVLCSYHRLYRRCIIYAARKPSWKSEDTEFAPFHWEENTTAPETGTTIATQTEQKPVNKNTTE